MRARTLRTISFVHKWTSLFCTVFMLIICLTGLPLIFRDKIDAWLDNGLPYAQVAPNAPVAGMDDIIRKARGRYPSELIASVFIDDDEPQVLVTMAPSWKEFNDNPLLGHRLRFDAHTGILLWDENKGSSTGMWILSGILHLHTDFFSDLPGELFFAFVAATFLAALVSGVLLYGPFMKRLPFGSVRVAHATRVRWLDLHNLLGIVLTGWMGVVGATGLMNELSRPLFTVWRGTEVNRIVTIEGQKRGLIPADLLPVAKAFQAAQLAEPGMRIVSAIFPGSRFGTPFHYFIWTKGKTPLTGRLFTPVLVDARNGKVTAVVLMPWYLRALEVSRPLHFGDYGGTPLKVIWALLDLVVIAVLVSGLVIWAGKRKIATHARLRALGYELDDPSQPAPLPHAAGEAVQ